jgi:hypothetical protein
VAPGMVNGRLRWMRWLECREVGEVTPDGERREGELTERWQYRMKKWCAHGTPLLEIREYRFTSAGPLERQRPPPRAAPRDRSLDDHLRTLP